MLEVESESNIIILDDEKKENEIKLKAIKTGFGDIQIKTQCSFGGKIISYGNDIIDEIFIDILHSLFEMYLSDLQKGWKSNEIEVEESFKEINFDNISLDKIITELTNKFDEKIELIGDYSTNEKDQFEIWLHHCVQDGAIKEIIPTLVKSTLVNTILKYIGKNRNESAELSVSEVHVKSRIKSEIDQFDVEVQYRDLLENEYKPISLPITVKDRRTNPSKVLIRLNINFKDFSDESIKNANEITEESL